MRRAPCLCGRGGAMGRGVTLSRSVPLPSPGRQQRGRHWCRPGHGERGPHIAPVRARLPSPGAVRVAPWRVGAGSLVLRGSCGSRRLGTTGGLCSGNPLSGAAVLPGGGGTIPSASGGGEAAPPRLASRWWGAVGGVALRPPCSPSGERPAAPYPAPLSSPAHSPPGVRVRPGPRGRPVHQVRPAWRGGGGGAAREPPPTDPTRPSALPEWATLRVSVALPWLLGARPPYCSGSSSRAAPGRGPCVAPARRCWLARRPRTPRERAVGGARARGVRVQLRPPPGVAVPSGGGGTSPRLRGGGGPAPLRLAGRGGAGGGREGGPFRCSPPPCSVGWPVASPPVILCLWRAPLEYIRAVGVAELPGASGAARSAASGSLWRGGGEGGGGVISSPWSVPPPSPGRPLSAPLRLRPPRCRRSLSVGRG